jgi:DNA helicase-2/ATP-dependent DNA helicase PcrA
MVDEFQDTNYAQYIVVRKLAAQHQNICVVGDDAQSIYAFRGANIQNILSFENDYTDLSTFKLEQNYRSTGVIVNAANSVIANNKAQLPKKVWTHNNEGDKITLYKTLSDNEEGAVVASAIFEARMRDQLMNNDFAVLYRTNAQSRAMEEALRKKGIPYRIYGGISFYSRKEIKDLLAYFRLAVNPDDEEALKRVINYPKREIGKTSWEKLVVAAHNSGISIWKLIEQIHKIETGIAAATRNRIADFVSMIKSFSALLGTKDAYELASHIASSTGLLKELYNDRTPEGISHYENVQELLNAIKEFTDKGETGLPAPSSEEEVGSEFRTLDVFLQDIALITDTDKETDEKDVVSLMTIHSAKGLEFRNVFVVGLEENLFPSQMSMQSRNDLEEERRLFYVAITRAEKKLYLSYAASRYRWGNLTGCEPSRFLDEIDDQFLESTDSEPQNDFADLRRTNWSGFGSSKKVNVNKTVLPGPGFRRLRKNDVSAATPAQATFEASAADEISVGMEVEHQKFGSGKVINIEGAAPDIKATVFFPGHGNKHLLLKFAKLRIIS